MPKIHLGLQGSEVFCVGRSDLSAHLLLRILADSIEPPHNVVISVIMGKRIRERSDKEKWQDSRVAQVKCANSGEVERYCLLGRSDNRGKKDICNS